MKNITNIADLRNLAKQKVPKAIFDYADRGSYDEITIKNNKADLEKLALRQRVMLDVSTRNLKTKILGQDYSMPLGIAPTGLTGLFHGNGEILGAQAAEEANIPFILSTMSICSIEQVAAKTTKPFWFQLYVMKDKEFIESLIARAKKANCSALVLTADLQIQGQRHQDIKNGLTVPPKLTLNNLIDVATKPAWGLKLLASQSRSFGNLKEYMQSSNISTLSKWIANQFDASLSWQDIAWIRKNWHGKLVLKGILDVEDAKQAVKHGVDAIVVSNHGGRQLDSAKSSISQLAKIVKAVGQETEIIFDSGVTTGQDILKAMSLGASSCLIGKAFLYSLAAGGKQGVATAIEILRKELDVSMALTGTTDINKVNETNLVLD